MLKTTLIYGVTFLISLIFCRKYEKTRKNNRLYKNILLILGILLPPIILATIRYNVGTDYRAYVINFSNINFTYDYSIIWKFYSREPLYVIINILGYWLGFFKNGLGFFFLSSCIYMFFIFKSISYFEEENSITLSLFIFYMTYYLVFYNALRQMIAVAIILFALRYIFERKPLKYIIFVIIAGMFHKTAYVMIFLYFLNLCLDFKKINKLFYITIIFSPLLMIPIKKIIVYFTNKFMIYENYANMVANFDLKFLLYVLPILFLVIIKRKKILNLNPKYEILIKILFLQIPFQFLGCFVNIADRMAIYCAIFQIILIPIILRTDMNYLESEILDNNNLAPIISNNKLLKKCLIYMNKLLNNKKIIFIGIIVWYVIYFIVIYAILKGQGVYPYQSIFSVPK